MAFNKNNMKLDDFIQRYKADPNVKSIHVSLDGTAVAYFHDGGYHVLSATPPYQDIVFTRFNDGSYVQVNPPEGCSAIVLP